MRPILSLRVVALAGSALLLGGCGAMHHHHHGAPGARAVLEPTRGNTTAGTVMFHAVEGGLMLHVRVSGLKPGQEHGFHVHEKGDCSSGDGMSTGGHFNPTGKPHGQPGHGDHHAGDLPALKADAEGKVDVRLHAHGITLGSGATSVVGRGLIVHAQPDDYKTQPTGNSGARVACAVITAMPA